MRQFENVSKFTANSGRIKNWRVSTVGQYMICSRMSLLTYLYRCCSAVDCTSWTTLGQIGPGQHGVDNSFFTILPWTTRPPACQPDWQFGFGQLAADNSALSKPWLYHMRRPWTTRHWTTRSCTNRPFKTRPSKIMPWKIGPGQPAPGQIGSGDLEMDNSALDGPNELTARQLAL